MESSGKDCSSPMHPTPSQQPQEPNYCDIVLLPFPPPSPILPARSEPLTSAGKLQLGQGAECSGSHLVPASPLDWVYSFTALSSLKHFIKAWCHSVPGQTIPAPCQPVPHSPVPILRAALECAHRHMFYSWWVQNSAAQATLQQEHRLKPARQFTSQFPATP